MATVYKTTFQLRRGLAEIWERNNPILAKGEPGFVLDQNRLKIGDGVTPWLELDYIGESDLQELPELKQEIALLRNELNTNYYTKKDIEVLIGDKVEIQSAPKGTLINIYDREVRIMCPSESDWQFQESGENAQENRYYIGFRIYAPNSAYSFKEDLGEIIEDNTMYYFEDNPYAGIDENGRKYSLIWLPVAQYDEVTATWSYFGDKSTKEKFIGWNYIVDWYNYEGEKIEANSFRINLSNPDCHYMIEPYYMGSINVNKLAQKEGDYLILYGGSATDNI